MTIRDTKLTVRHQGQNFSGSWHVEDKVLHLTSPYGSRFAQVNGERPSSIAKNLMLELVRSWTPVRREMWGEHFHRNRCVRASFRPQEIL